MNLLTFSHSPCNKGISWTYSLFGVTTLNEGQSDLRIVWLYHNKLGTSSNTPENWSMDPKHDGLQLRIPFNEMNFFGIHAIV